MTKIKSHRVISSLSGFNDNWRPLVDVDISLVLDILLPRHVVRGGEAECPSTRIWGTVAKWRPRKAKMLCISAASLRIIRSKEILYSGPQFR